MDENHRRALRSNLLVVERQLNYICTQLEPNVNKSVSYVTRNDMNPEIKARILSITETMVHEIKRIMDEFSLESREESARNNVQGALSEIWSVLEDSRPERLKTYGNMSKRDRESLRPHILRLQETLDEIYKIIQ